MRWAGQVESMDREEEEEEEEKACWVLVEKREGKKLTERPTHLWEYNIKWILEK
jgi:hypothetical protein